jgi:hypothetical protein
VSRIQDSLRPYHVSRRNILIRSGKLAKLDGHFFFTDDVVFDSPSQAACIVTGNSRNGLDVWRDKRGASLKNLGFGQSGTGSHAVRYLDCGDVEINTPAYSGITPSQRDSTPKVPKTGNANEGYSEVKTPEDKISRLWETARAIALKGALVDQPLREVGSAVGVPWMFLRSDQPLKWFLNKTWGQVKGLRGFGAKKTTVLHEIVCRAARLNTGDDQMDDLIRKHRVAIKSESDNGAALAGEDRERAWDYARRILSDSDWAGRTLCDVARDVGFEWRYVLGDAPLKQFIDKPWTKICQVRGFGEKKISLLYRIARKAAEDVRQSSGLQATRGQRASTIGAGLALTRLGIDPTTPVELVALSERARALVRRKQINSLGRLLEFLEQEGPSRLREYKGVGESTATELVGLLQVIQIGRPDLVRRYLPIRKSGAGLSLFTAAGRLLDEMAKEDREALFIYFGQGETLRATGKQSGRTGARVSQVTSGFLKGLDEILVHFPDEKQALWEAWERCEPLQGLLDEDLDDVAKQTVAGAIGRLFESSSEGRAIRQHRKELFSRWWKDVRAAPEFYLGGIRVPQFIRSKGEPYLLMSFLEYLEARSGISVSRSSGKAWPTKLPLKRFVKAVIETSADRMTLPQLHERVTQIEFFENLQLTDLEKKICRWEGTGFIPAGRIVSE